MRIRPSGAVSATEIPWNPHVKQSSLVFKGRCVPARVKKKVPWNRPFRDPPGNGISSILMVSVISSSISNIHTVALTLRDRLEIKTTFKTYHT